MQKSKIDTGKKTFTFLPSLSGRVCRDFLDIQCFIYFLLPPFIRHCRLAKKRGGGEKQTVAEGMSFPNNEDSPCPRPGRTQKIEVYAWGATV